MNTEHTPSLIPDADKHIEVLLEVTGFQKAVETLQAAAAAARPLTDAEKETVTRSACRLAGILLDAARMARKMGPETGGIRSAEEAADELIKLVNRLNGCGEGEEE